MTLECIIQYQAHTYNLVFYIILILKKKESAKFTSTK